MVMDIFRVLDYFVAGRDTKNFYWIDYAGQTGTKVLSAFDSNPFYWLKLEKR